MTTTNPLLRAAELLEEQAHVIYTTDSDDGKWSSNDARAGHAELIEAAANLRAMDSQAVAVLDASCEALALRDARITLYEAAIAVWEDLWNRPEMLAEATATELEAARRLTAEAKEGT